MRKAVSLRAQAVACLAQREYSVREMRAKLMRRLQTRLAAQAKTAIDSASDHDPDGDDDQAVSHDIQVDEVIAWLLQRGYLDEERFVASRVNVRAARFGVSRIVQELSRHGLDLPDEVSRELRSNEFERARSIWQRRYDSAPADAREAARQARFLAGRGFSGEVIRQVLRAARQSGDVENELS